MELGARLKQARLEKGLSQRQLCGEEITRNMLSQIENGSAKPSMTTLAYLARRLEKPISYFLEEGEQTSPNQACILRARQAYAAGQYRLACQILEEYRQPDPVFDAERWLLEAISLLGQASSAVAEGKYIFAQKLTEKAAEAGEKTPYYTASMERECLLLRYTAQPENAAQISAQLQADYRESFLRAEALLHKEDFAGAANILDSIPESSDRYHLLRAKAAMGQKAYAVAIEHYLAAEESEPQQCAQALEQCYLALEDYKQAYHYACKQRNLQR